MALWCRRPCYCRASDPISIFKSSCLFVKYNYQPCNPLWCAASIRCDLIFIALDQLFRIWLLIVCSRRCSRRRAVLSGLRWASVQYRFSQRRGGVVKTHTADFNHYALACDMQSASATWILQLSSCHGLRPERTHVMTRSPFNALRCRSIWNWNVSLKRARLELECRNGEQWLLCGGSGGIFSSHSCVPLFVSLQEV